LGCTNAGSYGLFLRGLEKQRALSDHDWRERPSLMIQFLLRRSERDVAFAK